MASQNPGETDEQYEIRRLREKNPFEGSIRTTEGVPSPFKPHILGTVGEGRDRNTVADPVSEPIVNGQTGGGSGGGGAKRVIITDSGVPNYYDIVATFVGPV
jgi:hypothetical protein